MTFAECRRAVVNMEVKLMFNVANGRITAYCGDDCIQPTNVKGDYMKCMIQHGDTFVGDFNADNVRYEYDTGILYLKGCS